MKLEVPFTPAEIVEALGRPVPVTAHDEFVIALDSKAFKELFEQMVEMNNKLGYAAGAMKAFGMLKP